MAENVPEFSYFPHDREQLLNTIARFDDGLREEDVLGPENQADNLRQYSNTVLIQVLLEFICHALVKDENQRETLLMEACRRLSKFKILNDLLVVDRYNALRMTMRCNVINFLKQVSKDVIPTAELDATTVNLFQENRLSTDLKLFYYDNFIELGKIGEGGFGMVYKVQYKLNKLIYAVKKIPFVYKTDRNFVMVMREANNLAALSHPNVVRYQNSWIELSESDAVSEQPSDANLARNGFVIKEMPVSPAENTDSLSKNDLRKNYKISESVGSEIVEFSESAKISNDLNYSVGNYIESFSSYSDEDTKKDYDNEDTKDEDDEDDEDDDDLPPLSLKMKGVLYIQMEYCECDLSFWLSKRAETKGKDLPFQMDVIDIFTNIVKGVAHIHSRNIIHRDLKPHNIFYSRSYNTVKIGDFGLATLVGFTDSPNGSPHNLSSVAGSSPYAAPEQQLGKNYDKKVDIYSLGVILIELINTCSTYSELCDIINSMKAGKIVEGNEKFPVLGNLASILISVDPKRRMSAKEILDLIDKDTKVILKEVVINEFWEEIQAKETIIKSLQEKEKHFKETIQDMINEKEENFKKTIKDMQAIIDQQNSKLNKIFSELNLKSE